MLYGKRLAVPLRAVWNTELAKAYAEATHGTTRGYTKHRLHATVKSNTTFFCGQMPCVRVEWDRTPICDGVGSRLPARVDWRTFSKYSAATSGGSPIG